MKASVQCMDLSAPQCDIAVHHAAHCNRPSGCCLRCPSDLTRGRPPTPDHSSDPSWCSTRQLTYGDGTSPSLSPRAKQRRIIDTFTFNDEFDMLDIRLHTLWDVVDTFVIVESNTTFTGKPKQLHFFENQGRYTEFMSKIHHYVMVYPQEMPPGQWERERAARKAQFSLEQSLKGVALTTDDLIVMADLDELMDPSMLETLKWCDGANLDRCMAAILSSLTCMCASSYMCSTFDTGREE
ncbi:glycosyltransferase family 17 [Haematococcus lacustris]|uniref:Glycosyltransferase family 17 n=1 Tax=Haematococcus lacustris TaxID=44745 RepID=A0A6A0AHT0_HAELA|nr:glycosyltransferase family 17 [Haematococcus lacustris]